MLPDLDAVTASYHRCRASDHFIDTFYEHFLAKSREVAEKFRGTDFTRQKFMLRESLLMMLLFNHDEAGAVEELERLAERFLRPITVDRRMTVSTILKLAVRERRRFSTADQLAFQLEVLKHVVRAFGHAKFPPQMTIG